jgi:hypothetical protein
VAGWKNPGRAQLVVIHVEAGGSQQYRRAEGDGGKVVWSQSAPRAGQKPSGDAMTTAELAKVVEGSLSERRRGARGLKFRL